MLLMGDSKENGSKRRFWSLSFCKTCFVHVSISQQGNETRAAHFTCMSKRQTQYGNALVAGVERESGNNGD